MSERPDTTLNLSTRLRLAKSETEDRGIDFSFDGERVATLSYSMSLVLVGWLLMACGLARLWEGLTSMERVATPPPEGGPHGFH